MQKSRVRAKANLDSWLVRPLVLVKEGQLWLYRQAIIVVELEL